MEVDCLVKRIKTGNQHLIQFAIPDQAVPAFTDLFRKGRDKTGETYRLRLALPFRPRSTGKFSQSHRINGFIQQMAMSTGIPFQGLKEYCKAESIGEGYPFVTLPTGAVIGKSEADISVEEASILIGTIERIAAEWNITLIEE